MVILSGGVRCSSHSCVLCSNVPPCALPFTAVPQRDKCGPVIQSIYARTRTRTRMHMVVKLCQACTAKGEAAKLERHRCADSLAAQVTDVTDDDRLFGLSVTAPTKDKKKTYRRDDVCIRLLSAVQVDFCGCAHHARA
jgi:hypothetical protein